VFSFLVNVARHGLRICDYGWWFRRGFAVLGRSRAVQTTNTQGKTRAKRVLIDTPMLGWFRSAEPTLRDFDQHRDELHTIDVHAGAGLMA
jgi:hypothetical protein